MRYIVLGVGSLAENLHKSFIDVFVPRLNDALKAKILHASEAQLRTFNKQRMDEIVNTMWDKLMARLLPLFDTQVQKNIFYMDVSVVYLQQKFLEKRIDGAKIIETVCNQALMNSSGTTQQSSTDLRK